MGSIQRSRFMETSTLACRGDIIFEQGLLHMGSMGLVHIVHEAAISMKRPRNDRGGTPNPTCLSNLRVLRKGPLRTLGVSRDYKEI